MSIPAKLRFQNADGEVLDFLTSWIGIRELRGFEGGDTSHRRVESPLADGSSYLNSRKLDMRPMIQFEVEGITWAQMTARRRQVASVLRPKSGEGVLRYQPHDASDEYELVSLVDRRASAPRRDSFSQIEIWTVQFRAGDPFWNVVPTNEDALEAGGYRTIDNVGDDESYPVVTFTPAATGRNPFVRNVTTGHEVRLGELSLDNGEELVIDMQQRTVKLDDEDVAQSLIEIVSRFWTLERGENVIVGSSGAPLVGTGDDDGGAGTAWTAPDRITQETTNASVSLTTTNSSQLLLGTNLGLSVPSDATNFGVRAIFRARTNSTVTRQVVVQLWDGSAVIGDNKGDTNTADFPVSASDDDLADVEYGGYDDDWGATLSHTIVNASGFGVALRIQNVSSASTQTHVRSVYLEVFWTEADGTPGSQVAIVHPTKLDGV